MIIKFSNEDTSVANTRVKLNILTKYYNPYKFKLKESQFKVEGQYFYPEILFDIKVVNDNKIKSTTEIEALGETVNKTLMSKIIERIKKDKIENIVESIKDVNGNNIKNQDTWQEWAMDIIGNEIENTVWFDFYNAVIKLADELKGKEIKC